MSDCLHCDINEVVREHIERTKTVDLAGLAADMAESLAELILLAPEDQQGAMLADELPPGHVVAPTLLGVSRFAESIPEIMPAEAGA